MENLRLSIEEMAYVMGMLNGGEQAGSFLKTIIGERDRNEMEGRLISAAHTLMARGWITLEENQKPQLNSTIQSMFEHMLRSRFSLRASKTIRGEEDVISYFFGAETITEHGIEQAVISTLSPLSNWEEFAERLQTFLEIQEKNSEFGDQPLATISSDTLSRVKDCVETSRNEEAEKLLRKEGFGNSQADTLVKDLSTARWRGSVLRIVPEDKALNSENGFLVLKSEHRSWLFEVLAQDEAHIVVLPGSTEVLRSLLMRLTK